jgi:hypothetical protein
MTRFSDHPGIVDHITDPVIRLFSPHHIVDLFALISLLYHHTIDDPSHLIIFSLPPPINDANPLMKFFTHPSIPFSEPS